MKRESANQTPPSLQEEFPLVNKNQEKLRSPTISRVDKLQERESNALKYDEQIILDTLNARESNPRGPANPVNQFFLKMGLLVLALSSFGGLSYWNIKNKESKNLLPTIDYSKEYP
jgi:hypothetical protein